MIIVTRFNNGEYMKSEDFIGKYIAFLYRDCQKYLDKELEPYNIGSGQVSILMCLFEADGINQESISRTIKVDKTSITRSIQKLIEGGYVVRQKDEEDNRSFRVFLTGKGRQIEPDIWKIASGWEEILLSGFDADHRGLIVDSLKDMSANVSRKMED